MAYRYEDVDQDARDRIEKGVVAIRRINEHEGFRHWLAVGEACATMQSAAMRLAGSNIPKGKGYNGAFKVIAEANPDLDHLDKTTRSHAVWMADPARRSDIEAWHARLPDNIRQMVNHPTVVYRRFAKETAVPADGVAKPASGGGLKAEVMRLQSELDAAQSEIAKLKRPRETVSEGTDWTWTDPPETIAQAWLRLYPAKAPQIASKVLELSKSTAPRKPAKSRKVNREPASERHW